MGLAPIWVILDPPLLTVNTSYGGNVGKKIKDYKVDLREKYIMK